MPKQTKRLLARITPRCSSSEGVSGVRDELASESNSSGLRQGMTDGAIFSHEGADEAAGVCVRGAAAACAAVLPGITVIPPRAFVPSGTSHAP